MQSYPFIGTVVGGPLPVVARTARPCDGPSGPPSSFTARSRPSALAVHEREVLVAEEPGERLRQGHRLELRAHLARIRQRAPHRGPGLALDLVQHLVPAAPRSGAR